MIRASGRLSAFSPMPKEYNSVPAALNEKIMTPNVLVLLPNLPGRSLPSHGAGVHFANCQDHRSLV